MGTIIRFALKVTIIWSLWSIVIRILSMTHTTDIIIVFILMCISKNSSIIQCSIYSYKTDEHTWPNNSKIYYEWFFFLNAIIMWNKMYKYGISIQASKIK